MRSAPPLLAALAAMALLACRAIPTATAPPVASVGAASAPGPDAAAGDVPRTSARSAGDAARAREGEDRAEVLDDGALRPCDPDDADATTAKAAIAALGGRIATLRDDGDPRALTAELEALLATRCFAMAAGDPARRHAWDSALSLKTWWSDGGEAWLEHYVDLLRTRAIVVPPSARRTLVLDGNASHALAPLLCPVAAASCGADALGWIRRADASLLRRAGAARAGAGRDEEACAREASAAEPGARFPLFRACIDDLATTRDALPLGRFKAPVDGWLVVRDTRGWSRTCETVRTYDLATGAAFVAEACASAGGAPRVKASSGRVGVAGLREAAWMLALSQVTEARVRTTSQTFEVPDDVPIERPAAFGTSVSFRCGGVSSGGARDWSWMRSEQGALRGRVSGHVRAPHGRGDAEGHAMELLSIVDDGFEEGCAPARPPRGVAWDAPGPSAGGREAATLASAATPAVEAALGAASAPACARKP